VRRWFIEPFSTRVMVLSVIALGIGTGAASATIAPPAQPPEAAALDAAANVGRGEAVLVVLGPTFASRAEADRAATALTFGEMQGFYVDTTDNYDLLGAYAQLTPDIELVKCGRLDIGCQPEEEVRAQASVTLALREGAALEVLVSERIAACGQDGAVPCMAERLERVISPRRTLVADQWVLLSAFRTKVGAEQFVELARAAGASDLVVLRVRKVGGPYVGLGQEAHPDGVSGPLLEVLPDAKAYQQ